MRLGGLGEGKGRVDHRGDLTGLEERPDLPLERARDPALLLHRAGTQRRARDRQPALQHGAEIHLRRRPAEEGDEDEPPLPGQALEVAGDVASGHHVEDHVDTASVGLSLHDAHEVLFLVVDGALRAQSLARRALLGGPGGGQDPGPGGAPELDRRGADAAGSPVDEERLPPGEPAPLEDVRPDREEGLGEGRGLNRREAARDGQALGSRGQAVLGVASAGDEGAGLVAHLPALDAVADGHDRPRHLEPGDVGRAGRGRVAALPLEQVGAVDPGRGHAQEHLTGPGGRHRPPGGPENLRAAGASDLDGQAVGGKRWRGGRRHGDGRGGRLKHDSRVASLQCRRPVRFGPLRSWRGSLDSRNPREI